MILDSLTNGVVIASVSKGGMLDSTKAVDVELVMPEKIVPGSLRSEIKVYSTPVANIQEALAALIRQPFGCFEQASSTVYPLVMAQTYFKTHSGVDPQLIQRYTNSVLIEFFYFE